MTTLPRRTPGAHLLPIRADQWHSNGDHPDDHAEHGQEGRVVRYYRHPDVPGHRLCPHCHLTMHIHGWIDTGDDGYTVCPGDFILTLSDGHHMPIPAHAFLALVKELTTP